MKVTIDIPDSTLVMTYQFVFVPEGEGGLSIQQKVQDSNALYEFRRAKEDEEP